MRLVLAMALAGLVASPLSVSAQAGETEATSEPGAEEPAPEEPALQLQLDDAGVDVVPSPPRTADGYTLEKMELRVKRAKVGLCVSTVSLVVGAVIAGAAGAASVNRGLSTPSDTSNGHAAVWVGTALVGVGGVSMIATGVLLGVRKRKLRRLQQAHYTTPRRVQWDLARSRLVF